MTHQAKQFTTDANRQNKRQRGRSGVAGVASQNMAPGQVKSSQVRPARQCPALLWARLHTFIFFRTPSSCRKSAQGCFTGQPPGDAISVPAAPGVQEELGAKSKSQLFKGGLGVGFCSSGGELWTDGCRPPIPNAKATWDRVMWLRQSVCSERTGW